jgi:uncharacterized surface anchored protein
MAGKGFVNAPKTGALRIIKTSSDGKAEGFSFRVTGSGYDESFTSDARGEILIENLRIGEYTVSEVSDSASAGYIRPADVRVTVIENAVAMVEMRNTAKDTPKTGDGSNPVLWLIIMAISVFALLGIHIVGKRGKFKKEVEAKQE